MCIPTPVPSYSKPQMLSQYFPSVPIPMLMRMGHWTNPGYADGAGRLLLCFCLPFTHSLLSRASNFSIVQLCIFRAQQAPLMAQLPQLQWKMEPNRREQPPWMSGGLVYSTPSPAPGRCIHSTSPISGLHRLLMLPVT